MKNTIFLGIFSLMVCLLSGCNSPKYLAGGHEFDTENEAMDYLKEAMTAQLEAIKPLYYFGGSLMVHVPSMEMLSNPPFAPPATEATPEEIAFIAKKHKYNYMMIVQAIRKASMFDCVLISTQKDMIEYGKRHGFRYAFIYNGGSVFYLADLMQDKDKEVEFSGNLREVTVAIESAVVKFEGDSRNVSLADKFSPVDFLPKWNKETLKGSVSVKTKDNPYACRAWLINNIRKIVSGQKDPKGFVPAMNITSETLSDGVLTLNFRSTKPQKSVKKASSGLRDYYKPQAKEDKTDK